MDNQIKFEANHGNKVDKESTLEAQEWNQIMRELDTVIAQIPTGGDGSGSGTGTQSIADTHISKSAKGNVEFVTTQEDLNAQGKGGKINIESYSDIQIKPGDDVIFTSSHRPVKNLDEVSVKIHDGQDHPVKLQVNTADIVLTTKDKNLTRVKKDDGSDDPNTAMYDDPAVLNVTVNSAKDTRGYLKVRAQAIDLRSETHGGIALQPKGNDGQGHENKIKFEHGGGDGLEFGTFNTEKTSIFTRQYRFNKNGVWKMATRQTEVSDKADANDSTTARKYVKQSDDFYDIISNNDRTATTEQIITAGSMVTTFADSDQVMICDVKNNLYTVKSVDLEELQMEPDFVIDSEVHTNLPTVGNNLSPEDAKIYAITDKLSSSELDQFELMLQDPRIPIIVKYTTISDSVNGEGNLSFQISRSVADITLYGGGASNGETNDVKVSDIAKLVAYMKSNHQGPWAN